MLGRYSFRYGSSHFCKLKFVILRLIKWTPEIFVFVQLNAWIYRWYTFHTLKLKFWELNVFFMQLGHRHCLATIVFILDIYLWWLHMHCSGSTSITIIWSLNVFINDFTLACLRVKKFCQVIRVRPAHSLKVLQLSPDVNASFLFYAKFEIIQLPREESAVKSNVSSTSKMLLQVLRVLTLLLLTNSLQSVFSLKHMWLKWN